MRSVLVVHPSAEMYGADRMLLEAVAGFVGPGTRCTVVLPGTGPLADAVARTGAAVVLLPTPVLRKTLMSPSGVLRFALANLVALPRALAALRRAAPDAVYVSTVTVPLWLAVARLARRPVLCHVHEAEEGVPRLVRRALAAPLLLAGLVVTNSEASRAALVAEWRGLRARSRVVYNGVPGPAEVVPARERLGPPVRLVLVGRVSPRKGTDVAVDALALLVAAGRDVHLDLVGGVFPGYEWFEEQVRERAASAGVADRVHWRGVQPDPFAALALADVALVPSRVEPFGNTAVEALLAERPLVAARAQGLREVVAAAGCGELVEPGDAGDLARAVAGLLDDWPAALGRARDGRRQAALRFAPERYRAELTGCLAELVAGR